MNADACLNICAFKNEPLSENRSVPAPAHVERHADGAALVDELLQGACTSIEYLQSM
jgi:hypothetical protein